MMTRRQAQILINKFNNLSINQQSHMEDPFVNYVLSPFEGKINPGYPHGLKLYLKSTKEIDKESDKLDISVSNAKDIIDHFLSISNKYGWGRLAFMAQTGAGANIIFRQLEHIQLSYIHHESHGKFVLIGIRNVVNALPNPLVVLYLINVPTSAQEVQNFYDRVFSDMIANEI